MAEDNHTDHYEALQISQNAEPETISRVFRLFAQRFHPDNPLVSLDRVTVQIASLRSGRAVGRRLVR